MRRLWQVAMLVLSVALAGCVKVVFSEANVFDPLRTPPVAQSEEELALNNEQSLGPAVSVHHGFVGEGEARIAYSILTMSGPHRPLIVECGGNASDRRRDGAYYAHKALEFGDVMLLDYPGYGDSGGEPNKHTMESFADRVAEFVRAYAGDQKVVYWGHSLGGFVCAQILRRTPESGGMIFEASALNLPEVADAWIPWVVKPFVHADISPSLLAYDNAIALKDFSGPVLVLGAGRDMTLPVGLSRSLARVLQKDGRHVSYVEFKQAGHSDIPEDPDFRSKIAEYFARLS